MRYQIQEKMTIFQYFERFFQGMSKNTRKKWLEQERILVNDATISSMDHVLEKGDIVSVREKVKYEGEVPLIYEDRDLVVIDKPKGLLSVATPFEERNNLHSILKKRYYPKKVYVVHRLDQDTSGLMLFALSEKAYLILKEELMHHRIERRYLAIVESKALAGKGTWETYLYEDDAYFVHVVSSPEKAVKAITHYEVIAQNEKYAAVLFTLETGKKNQIRAQAQYFQAPLVGDVKYGGSAYKRLCLHSVMLSFEHPITKKRLRFSTPLPPEFLKLITFSL